MPRISTIDLDPVDVDADGIAQAQTPGGAGNFTLNGDLISGGVFTSSDGGARQLLFTTVDNESGDTYTITGTDADGRAQTETVTGPNATTGESTKYFLTVTQIATSGAATDTVAIGTVDEMSSRTFPLNRHADTGALIHMNVTGTIDWTVQITGQDIQQSFTDQEAIAWVAPNAAIFTTTATDAISTLEAGATAMRVLVNSHSSGGEVQAHISQQVD